MFAIHEVATITSKGQITLPKPIRQALGVDLGGKVAFDFRGDQIVVSKADDGIHTDPAIAGFLNLLAGDIAQGRHVNTLPNELVESMAAAAKRSIDLSDEIVGDVAL